VNQLLVVALFIAAQGVALDQARISQQDFKKLVAGKNVTVLDTRDEDSYAMGHIPGAISLPDHDLGVPTPAADKVVARLKASKRPVVVYCACGAEVTSLRVAKLLAERGIADVRALTGGWVDWYNDGNPIERGR
jgi:rhodanese-related sulfurtransferase